MSTAIKLSKPCEVIQNLHTIKRTVSLAFTLQGALMDAEQLAQINMHSHGNMIDMIESDLIDALAAVRDLRHNVRGR